MGESSGMERVVSGKAATGVGGCCVRKWCLVGGDSGEASCSVCVYKRKKKEKVKTYARFSGGQRDPSPVSASHVVVLVAVCWASSAGGKWRRRPVVWLSVTVGVVFSC